MKPKINVFLAISTALVMSSTIAATSVDAQKGLNAACPGLKVHAADLKFEEPVKESASLTTQRDRKWSEVYLIKARVSDKPSGKLMSEFKAQGQSCYFEVEATKAQEVSVAKSPCQAICKDKTYQPGAVVYFGANGSEEIKR